MTIPPEDRVANRTLRQVRMELGLSQTEFARALRDASGSLGESNQATKRLVQKWESGEHATCRPIYRRALETLTGLAIEDLGLADEPPTWERPAAGELRWRMTALGKAPVEDAALRLRFALERPHPMRAGEVDALHQLGERLFGLEAVTPARTLLPMAQRQLSDTAAALAGTSPMKARRLLTVAGAYAAVVVGRLAQECGDRQNAERYLDAALAAARAADDAPLVAYVLTCAASSEGQGSLPDSGWHLAQGALQYAGEHPAVRAFVAARAAQEAVRCGEYAAARGNLETVAALDPQVETALNEAATPPWAYGLNRGVLAAMVTPVYATLGDDAAAYEHGVLAAHLVTWEPVKWRAVALAEAACAAARVGKTQQAEQWQREARALAVRLQYNPVLRTLLGLGPGRGRAGTQRSGGDHTNEGAPVIPPPRKVTRAARPRQ